MSDTPRTDAVEYDTGLRTAEECATGEDRGPDMVVPADHARTLERELAVAKSEIEQCDAIRDRMADLLTRTAVALRGPEPKLTKWSWHDLPERAAAERAKVARLREALERAGTMTSYAHEDDSVGRRMCCGVQSYADHSKSCWLIAALKDTDG